MKFSAAIIALAAAAGGEAGAGIEDYHATRGIVNRANLNQDGKIQSHFNQITISPTPAPGTASEEFDGTHAGQFECDTNSNWINGMRYSQISLTNYCPDCAGSPKYGGPNDNQKAVKYCEEKCMERKGCTGFFFQKHGNGHEICGFYTEALKTYTRHGHQAGAVCKKVAAVSREAATGVWGAPIDGKDVLGNTYSRNAGSADDQDGTPHSTTSEFTAAAQLSNCEALHGSASGVKHCLIGGKCGPCPIKTAFPTPAPTPAPTVPVANKCVRTGKTGKILGSVPFGWSGVGADNKYCILEMCQKCKNPTRRAAPYNDQLYCDMTPHSDMSESGNGACGKHQFTEDCEFVSCKYSPSTGLKVTVDQGSRGLGLFPEADKFITGDQHECRANKDSGKWACECKCASSPAKWAYTNGFSVRPKCTGAEKLTGTFEYFTSGKASGCEHRNHYLYDYRGSDCIWESNKIAITHPHGYKSMFARFQMLEYGNLEDADVLKISLKTCKKANKNSCSQWYNTIRMQDDVMGWRWTTVNGGPTASYFNGNKDWKNTPVTLGEDEGFVQVKVQLKSSQDYAERHVVDNLSVYGQCL